MELMTHTTNLRITFGPIQQNLCWDMYWENEKFWRGTPKNFESWSNHPFTRRGKCDKQHKIYSASKHYLSNIRQVCYKFFHTIFSLWTNP